MFAPEIDRVHYLLVLDGVRLHVTDELLTAGLLVALDFLDSLVRVAADDHVVPVKIVERDGIRVDIHHLLEVVIRPEV